MRVGPDHVRMDQRRPVAFAAVLRRVAHGAVATRGNRCRPPPAGTVREPDAVSAEMLPPGRLRLDGTEIAYPLSSTRKSSGRSRQARMFSDSQNSPSLVAPSPAQTSVISSLCALR